MTALPSCTAASGTGRHPRSCCSHCGRLRAAVDEHPAPAGGAGRGTAREQNPVREQLALLPAYLNAHVQLALFALLAGTAVSIPAGIAITRSRRLERPVLAVASVIQTVPSLALLAVMVPALSAGTKRIGFLPAFIGLTLYSVPVLRNTVTGLAGLDPALKEAARGVGMTSRQQLWRVELPLALPVILAGLRTSTVWTVGMATLSTPVGAPSLGNYIFAGLQTRNLTAVLVGCVAAAVLALVLDGLVRALGSAVLARRKAPLVTVITIFGLRTRMRQSRL